VDYLVEGQIYEEHESYDLFSALANQFGIIFYEDDTGRERFINVAPISPMLSITDDDILLSGESPFIEITRTDKDVFSSFYVDYQKFIPENDYERSAYVTPDNHNLIHVDAPMLQQLCHSALVTYNTEKRLTVKLDYVCDGETAERILAKLVQMYSSKKYVIRMQTSWRLCDLEIGDQVRLQMSAFSSERNFYVAGITADAETMIVDLTLFESPWTIGDTDVASKKQLASTVAITESIVYNLEDV
jgi:hypothetical protein